MLFIYLDPKVSEVSSFTLGSMMLERQREGIAIAKLKGKYKGKPVNIELNESIRALAEEGTNKSQIAKQLNCSRTTVYKALSS